MEELNPEKIWEGVLAAIKTAVSPGTYAMFLKTTSLVEIKEVGERLLCTIGVGSAMLRDTLDQRHKGQICDELERMTGKKCEVVFKIESRRAGEQESGSKDLPLFEEKKRGDDDWKRANLKSDYTFENYAVGGSNQMAYAAAQAVARRPGEAYNPLFIYGGVGVGKTHLMQAIGHEILERGETRVLFCPGEEFINDLVEAIRFKSTDKVRSKYRKTKALLIDDIQFIAGKQAVQEEFFHTYNAIVDGGGQIIMTSDRPPTEIPKLEARLRSRFGAGLIVDIGEPDFELKTAILLIKAKQKHINLPIEAAKMAAEHVEGVRELEGFLIRAKTEAEARGEDLSVETIERLLKVKSSGNGTRKMVTPNEIMTTVGDYFGVGVQQLKGERRTKTVAWARQVVMYILRSDMKLAQEEVGRLLGGRDHSTVLHAEGKVRSVLKDDENFRNQLGDMRKKLLMTG